MADSYQPLSVRMDENAESTPTETVAWRNKFGSFVESIWGENTGGRSTLWMTAGGVLRKLLDETGASDFMSSIQTLNAADQTNVINWGNGNVPFTTIDLSAKLPTTAKAAILQINASGQTLNDANPDNSYIEFRKDQFSATIATVGLLQFFAGNTGGAWMGIGTISTVIVPLTQSQTFQASKTDGINAGSGIIAVIRGYIQ